MGLYVLQYVTHQFNKDFFTNVLRRETPVGYALLKAKSSKLLKDGAFNNPSAEVVCDLLRLKNFAKFESAASSLEQSAALLESKVTPQLSSLLDAIKDEKKASLAVADPKLASAINKIPQLSLDLVSDASTVDLYRAIRSHLTSLVPGITDDNVSTMTLGLSHSLSRHKLKFSPDKMDTMIIHAVGLLDSIDKDLNVMAMRTKEWYGWHFPEMGRILNDNLAYARVIQKMGMRSNASQTDLSDILPKEIEDAIKSAAEISMGTEITREDVEMIQGQAEQVIAFTEVRAQQANYISERMKAIAPNLTAHVGDLIGARLIAHAGSLANFARAPASTVQIYGAEKALFRALKTKHDTPKYGILYNSSIVGQATGKNKGKIARVLAAKTVLGARIDTFSDWGVSGEGDADLIPDEERSAMGVLSRINIERKLARMEGRPLRGKGIAIGPDGASNQPGKWEVKEARKYNADADGLTGDEPAAASSVTNGVSNAKPASKLIEEVADEPMHEPPIVAEPDASDQEKDDVVAVAPELSKETRKETKEERRARKDAKRKAKEEAKAAKKAKEAKEVKQSADTPEPPTTEKASDKRPEKQPELLVDISAPSKANGNSPDDRSETISTVSEDTLDSPDSPTQQETNWQSTIMGNTKAAKKARKLERHERRLKLSEERSAKRRYQREKVERKLARQKRRDAKRAQEDRREKREYERLEPLAKMVGLSVVKYKKKLTRGEIVLDSEDRPHLKKGEKTEKEVKGINGDGKKRKRDDRVEVSEKKKKKKVKD